MIRPLHAILALFVLIASPSLRAESRESGRTPGYAILHDLLDDEAKLHEILIIKHASPRVSRLVRQISDITARERDALDQLGDSSPPLDFKDKGLPRAELETRKAIDDFVSHDLMSHEGPSFETRLLLTQYEGLKYASELARTLRDHESIPARRAFLDRTATETMRLWQIIVEELSRS